MSLIHGIVAHANGGLTGIQSTQRDWSPFLVHFTSEASMQAVREAVSEGLKPIQVREALETADRASLEVAKRIGASGTLDAHTPAGKKGASPCVCLSECTLPGLIALSERYGRFGFGFRKSELFASGARPCAYLGEPHYNAVKRVAGRVDATEADKQLLNLANTYAPPGAGGGSIKDFTHEREWRVFDSVSLKVRQPAFLICPTVYVEQVRTMFPDVHLVFPIDLLFEWGA